MGILRDFFQRGTKRLSAAVRGAENTRRRRFQRVLKGGKAHKGGRRSLATLVIEPDKIKSGRLRRVWRDGHSPPAPAESFHHRSQGEEKKSLICSSMQDCKQSVASEGSMSVTQ